MTWAKLDDQILQNPKIAECGGLGFAVHAAGIVYCCQNLTDGFVPYGVALGLLNLDGVGLLDGVTGEDATVLRVIRDGVPGYKGLQETGLWEWDAEKRGWWLHDFLDWNPSRESVLGEREKNRERMKTTRATGVRAKRKRSANGVRANKERTPPELQVQFTRPVPDPVPTTHHHQPVGSPPASQPVDDDDPSPFDEVSVKVRAVLDRCADSRMDGKTIANRPAYRATVLAEFLGREHELRDVIALHPTAPVASLAGWMLGEPNTLHDFRDLRVAAS